MRDMMMSNVEYDDSEWHDAGLEVYHAWTRYARSKTPVDQAYTLNKLSETLEMLFTWLPGYSYKTSEIFDPREES